MSAASAWPDVLLRAPVAACLRVVDTDEVIHLPVDRWHGSLSREEAFLLDTVKSPVLDIGCGPGRHSAALIQAGYDSLGIDISAAAIRSARRRGATVVKVSVFGPVPRAGDWVTALLLDGNIGIGGDPAHLLGRVQQILAPTGCVIVEVEPPERASRIFHARVQHAGRLSPRFPWASVSAEAIKSVGEAAGFDTQRVWREGTRWFAHLTRR